MSEALVKIAASIGVGVLFALLLVGMVRAMESRRDDVDRCVKAGGTVQDGGIGGRRCTWPPGVKP